MSSLKNLSIPFIGLKNKVHQLAFDLDESFFKSFEESPIKKGQLHIGLTFDKRETFFMLDFKVDGVIELPCDRCLEMFDYELMYDFSIIVKFEERDGKIGDEEDVIYLSRSESMLDLSKVIYDYTLINIPIQVVHPVGKDGQTRCNMDVIEKLGHKSDVTEVDPRWEKLKNIIK
jgi:uncharacterized metal-binding protein YceD (DUF177 family)